jgi:cardiolipin synthase
MFHDWIAEEIFVEGDRFFDSIVLDLKNATESVNLEFYIFEYENIGLSFLTELKNCVQRGLTVRLVVDGVGSFFSLKKIELYCIEAGIHFKVFNKIPFTPNFLSFFNVWSHLNLLRRISIFNRRTHRKMIIVDNKIAYIGSRNIAHVHFARFMNQKPWLDLSVRVNGDGVQKLNRSFEKVWRKPIGVIQRVTNRFQMSLRLLQTLKNYPVRLNYTLPMRIFFWWETNSFIKNAKKRVWIMNAYFVPHKTILNALKFAARKNTEVILCLPSKTDVPVVRWATLIFYKILLRDRIRVFEYDQSVLHTKLIIIDNFAIVGSHNLNYRSILHDLECEVILSHPKTMLEIENFWKSTLLKSHEITLTDKANTWIGLNWYDKLKGRLALMFRYYI